MKHARTWKHGTDSVQVAQFEMPWPPSVNHYYGRRKSGGAYIKPRGEQYRLEVLALSRKGRWPKFGKARLEVSLICYPPDRRERDLDNIEKALFDALQHAGVYERDSQIDKKTSHRRESKPPGSVVITMGVMK